MEVQVAVLLFWLISIPVIEISLTFKTFILFDQQWQQSSPLPFNFPKIVDLDQIYMIE